MNNNSKYQNIELMNIQNKLNETKEATKDAIENVLIRGDKIEKLVENTSHLEKESAIFVKTTKKLKKKMCLKKYKCIISFICIFTFIIYVFLAVSCNDPSLKHCM